MSRNGLSLLEILIAAGIMVAAMVPLWGLMGSSHKQITVSADEVRASQLANEILEQMENLHWFPDPGEVSFSILKNSKVSIGSNHRIDIEIGDFPDYLSPKGRVEVEKYPSSSPEAGRILRLIIDYKSKEHVGREDKFYQVSTFVAR